MREVIQELLEMIIGVVIFFAIVLALAYFYSSSDITPLVPPVW
jgi:uncharacterized protein YpmB